MTFKTLNISETKQDIEKLQAHLTLFQKCCSVGIKIIRSTIFSLQWYFKFVPFLYTPSVQRALAYFSPTSYFEIFVDIRQRCNEMQMSPLPGICHPLCCYEEPSKFQSKGCQFFSTVDVLVE